MQWLGLRRQNSPVPNFLDATCVWVFDGGPNPPVVPPDETPPTCVLAADGGLLHATAVGFVPDVLIGDLDSVSDTAVRQWQQESGPGSRLERHSPDKEASDLELALAFAAGLNPESVIVLSGGQGRLDHLLIATLCMGRWANKGLALTAYVGDSVVIPIAQGVTHPLVLGSDSVLTLLAVGGPARLATQGLRWNLSADEVLEPGSSRGLSNEPAQANPAVSVHAGTVLAIVTKSDSPT